MPIREEVLSTNDKELELVDVHRVNRLTIQEYR